MRTPRLLISISMLVAACVPYVQNYSRIEVPNARYFGKSCYGGFGPESVAYFPFHEIFISIDMNPWLRLGVHIPPGNSVQVLGRNIKIVGRTNSGNIDFSAALTPKPIGSLGSVNPDEFRAIDHSQVKPDESFFGPFQGMAKDGRYVWYLFTAFDQAPRDLLEGVIELPALAINGRRYEPQKLPFRRDTVIGFQTINC